MPDSGLQPIASPGRSKPGVEILGSVCPHDCPSTCALEVERLSPTRIGRVRGAEANSYTAGVICAKVARYAERIHHPDRLTRPLRRTGANGSGGFAPIGWEDALDLVAEAFVRATQRHGSEAVWPYYYAGTMGLVQRDGINRLRHAMRYSGMDQTICTSLGEAGWRAGVGKRMGPDPREMAESDLIIVWGGNPVATQVNVMTHVQRARKERGAKLLVVDPYRTGTAEAADQHVMLRPGSDGALACAMMHVLFRDGLADRGYMARYADVPEELEAHLATRDPVWAAGITGLAPKAIEALAHLYGRTPRSYIRLGYGFSRSRNGAANFHAVSCLPTVTGAWRHRGGGALWTVSDLYHWDKTLIEGLDVRDPAIRMLDMSRVGSVLTGDAAALQGGPPVEAMIVQNSNPAVVVPDSNLVRRGFARDDLFLCVHEQFMTETARLADIVLPATMFLEHDDLYQAGGHPHIQIGTKIVEPPGECRTNHAVISGLARRLGARHPGFEMTEWEIIDRTLLNSGWPSAEAVRDGRWHEVMPDFETAHFITGFPQPGGRFRFKPDWQALGRLGDRMPKLPDHFPAIEEADASRPFRLVAAPARQFLNTTFTETPGARKREGRPQILIHSADAAALGIAEGALAEVGNQRGGVMLHARLFDGVQRGVVVIESIWPHADFTGGLGVNALTGDDPAAPMGGAAFHDSAVWVRAAEA